MLHGLSKSAEDEFLMPILSTLPESPLAEGKDALITEFVKIIEHSFYPSLALFKVSNPLVQPFRQNDLTKDQSKSTVVWLEGNRYFLKSIYRRLPRFY